MRPQANVSEIPDPLRPHRKHHRILRVRRIEERDRTLARVPRPVPQL
jgi:hypothetical protein